MFVLLLLVAALAAQAQAATGVRLVLGLTDKAQVKWDGSVTARGARVTSIDGWRFEDGDEATGTSWRAQTRPIRLFGARGGVPPAVANGVIVWLADETPQATLEVKTAQGDFTVRLADIPYGKITHALNGRAAADRIPGFTRITDSTEEQDYPAAAMAKNGDAWLAYVEFKHHPQHNEIRAPLREPLSDFSRLKAPAGGDQVLARRWSGGKWGAPVEISPAGGDVYRPAVAIDGAGRAWVFWSANQKGNFDLWARPIENGKPGRAVQISTEPGADVNPAAVADSKGAVWVAWQGWRDGRAAVFAATQERAGFSKPAGVSNSQANEWNPAIAADGTGRVTVAWDSYRHGNYDVYTRTASSGKWGTETPAAASPKYEAYASVAYDRQGRLWVAWEEGAERWGKDWGAYETSGISLYQGRAVRLRVFEAGKAFDVAEDIGGVLPGAPSQRADSAERQAGAAGWERPDANRAKDRAASRTPANAVAPKNSMPRLTIDESGRVWVAFRSAHPIWWSTVGTVWTEHVASFDGAKWTGPVFLAHSDNLLDNRPAVVPVRAGEVMVIGSSDGRREWPRNFAAGAQRGRRKTAQPAAAQAAPLTDPYDNDLYANMVALGPATSAMALKAAPAVEVAGAAAPDKAERSTAALLRNYRLNNLRLVRGEFHRHSEISMDGGNDGAIIDQWRYMLDPAAMDWVGCCDHDNGAGREYTWWTTQKLTDVFHTPGKFISMFSYERSVAYPEGHRNVVFVQRGIRPLPRLPKADENAPGHAADTQMLYKYLRAFDGVVASHTSGTNMGTDWRDNDSLTEPVVEIYQGDRQNYEMPGAPRSNTAEDSIGGWRPKGFVNLALEMGYKLGFQASSDHISTHMSYCNLFVTTPTREGILDALKKRHVYGATDDILADVRSGDKMMGDAFETTALPELKVKLVGTGPFAKVHVIKDNKYVYSTEPKTAQVEFTWKDNTPTAGKTSYYYVRGDQEDGEIVWVSPMWITYRGK